MGSKQGLTPALGKEFMLNGKEVSIVVLLGATDDRSPG